MLSLTLPCRRATSGAQVPPVRPQQRQPPGQRLLKADFAGHALVGEGLNLAHAGGLVGLALQGNVGQFIKAFDLGKRAVEIKNQVGQGGVGVGHGGAKMR